MGYIFDDRVVGRQVSGPATNQADWAEAYRKSEPETPSLYDKIMGVINSESLNAIPGIGPLAKLPGYGAAATAGAVGMFMGPKAKWAEKAGNWFMGPDGRQRWELSDHDAKVTMPTYVNRFDNRTYHSIPLFDPNSAVLKASDYKLKDVLDHPNLYENYPDLADWKVKPMPLGSMMTTQAAVHPESKTMWLTGNVDPDQIKGSILHEIQHMIQDKEGFAKGGSIEQFLPEDWKAIYDADQGAAWELKQAAYQKYHRLAGEAEARLTDARRNMWPEERAKAPAYSNYDVPIGEQIVTFQDPGKSLDFRPPKGGKHVTDHGISDSPESWAKLLNQRWADHDRMMQEGLASGMTTDQVIAYMRQNNLLPLGYDGTMKMRPYRPQGRGN